MSVFSEEFQLIHIPVIKDIESYYWETTVIIVENKNLKSVLRVRV